MTPVFYDPSLSYDDSYNKGPSLSSTSLTPKNRTITRKTKLLGTEINVPFGIAAGPLLNSEFTTQAFRLGFDLVHYKTVRSAFFPSNPFPNVLFVDVDGDLTLKRAKKPVVGSSTPPQKQLYSITNSFGNPSKDPSVWQEDIKKALEKQGEGQLLIGSVVGTIREGFDENAYYNDFVKTAELVVETGVRVVEVNLSCPNVATEGVLCYTEGAVEAICKRTKEKIGNVSLIAKVGYYSNEQQELLESIIQKISPFISAMAVINTIPAAVVTDKGNQALPGEGRLKSGICGASIKWAGLDMVKRIRKIKEQQNLGFEIIGVGGVMTADDYMDYRNAGADAVQSVTGAMWNPNLAYEVWEKESK